MKKYGVILILWNSDQNQLQLKRRKSGKIQKKLRKEIQKPDKIRKIKWSYHI